MLLSDRAEFKIYAAEYHLNNLKSIATEHGDIAKEAVRVDVELEIDCFFAELIGAVDALLIQINEKLGLGLGIEEVNSGSVQSRLNSNTKHIDLLEELNKASAYDKWYWRLREFRNHTLHRAALKRVTAIHAFTDKPSEVRLVRKQRMADGNMLDYVMTEEIIPYFEKSIKQVRDLIGKIRTKEPALRIEYEQV